MMSHDLLLSDYSYHLPPELIAQEPAEPRDTCRLMVIDRDNGEIEHRIFYDIVDYLREGDLLVINDTRVIPARLFGRKQTGGAVEVLLLHQVRQGEWECLVKPGRRIHPGDSLEFGEGLNAEVTARTEAGGRMIRFYWEGAFLEVLQRLGEMPLPPYIKRKLEDAEKYQTVYSREPGSAAAPTAGLHFTPGLLEKLEDMGVRLSRLTLHVGLDTFRPLRHESVVEHRMHSEYYQIPEDTVRAVTSTRQNGGRVVAVGTTTTRALEAAFSGPEPVCSGWTDIFIYPGFAFKAVDMLLTNFHLPKTSLLLLVSAFAGRDLVLDSYNLAVHEGYRFFSFGDAMLIV
ncbi:MAG: tRNA preQ1(34) S-adenosylmethionine ribosyltransferase-isomerase QueA [bacterium]|nr:tRNA preQ1(34) S-adenosylmethionine ribosyltransferase-isomerase QueA [bacterium]